MAKTALLVVDVQNALVLKHPHCQATLMECLAYLLSACRTNGVEAVFVRHQEKDDPEMQEGTWGWQINEKVRPDYDTERVFDKQYNSSFKNTGLHDYLQEKGVDTLVIAGLQTEYCVDTTVKVAFELGYRVYIPAEGVSTYDNTGLTAEQINTFYLEHIWDGRYATVLESKELVEILPPAKSQ